MKVPRLGQSTLPEKGCDGVHVVEDIPALGQRRPRLVSGILKALLPLAVLADAGGEVGHSAVTRVSRSALRPASAGSARASAVMPQLVVTPRTVRSPVGFTFETVNPYSPGCETAIRTSLSEPRPSLKVTMPLRASKHTITSAPPSMKASWPASDGASPRS